MYVTFPIYAARLITYQGKLFEDLAKGTPIKKGPCVVFIQELEWILNLHVPHVGI